MAESIRHPSSYRDPSGFVFYYQDKYYRHIRSSYAGDYKNLMKELYEILIGKQFLLPHEEIKDNLSGEQDFFLTLLPEQIDFISYPNEWSFDQLKDTALVCLNIMMTSIEHGLILKDASPFNFQVLNGQPKLIDTLSFEIYNPNLPWIAYQQFCEGFLFPLMINHYLGLDAQQWLAIYPEGIPTFVTAKILPFRSRFSLGSWLHVFLPYTVVRKSDHNTNKGLSFSKRRLYRLLDHLYSLIVSLRFHNSSSQDWSTYYDAVHSDEYSSDKLKIFKSWIGAMDFVSCTDLGTNTGVFAKEAASHGRVIAIDMDSRCINQLYLDIRNMPEKNVHPLLIDLAAQAGHGGFIRPERKSLNERAKSELVLALAIIHHLVLIRNIPISDIASFCNELTTKYLIIEFVPLSDPKVQMMMADKKIFHQPYDYVAFEQAFQIYFHIEQSEMIAGTERKMYWMKKRNSYSAG